VEQTYPEGTRGRPETMTEAHTTAVQGGGPRREVLPAVLLLFFAGGCAALIYEIVWFQLLELVIGSTAVSLGIVL